MTLTSYPLGVQRRVEGIWDKLERSLAYVVAFIIGSRFLITTQITLGYLLALLLVPLWFPLARRARLGRALMLAALLALLNGLCLLLASADSRPVKEGHPVVVIVELIGVVATAGAMYWAYQRLGLTQAVLAYGVGMLTFVNVRSELFSASPWRFGFALPISVIVLALVARTAKPGPQIMVLLGLCVASIVGGARSPIGIQVLAVLFIWNWMLQGRVSASRTRSVGGVMVSLALTAVVVYTFAQALLLEGFLGDSAQQRTQEQVAESGTVILGGRPELGATLALMEHNPWGFGPGVMANWYDIQAARNGMAAIGYDPLNGYVDNYMFGDAIRLHSMTGELWASFGFGGLLLAGVILWTAISGISQGSRGFADALLLVLAIQTLWNLFFSPWYTSISALTLLLPMVWLRAPSPGDAMTRSTG